MTKNRIRLTESQLHNIIKESVKKILKESLEPSHEDFLNGLCHYIKTNDVKCELHDTRDSGLVSIKFTWPEANLIGLMWAWLEKMDDGYYNASGFEIMWKKDDKTDKISFESERNLQSIVDDLFTEAIKAISPNPNSDLLTNLLMPKH